MTTSALRVATTYAKKFPDLHKSGVLKSMGLLRSPDTYDLMAEYCGAHDGFDALVRLARAVLAYDRRAYRDFEHLETTNLARVGRTLCLSGDPVGVPSGLDLLRALNRVSDPDTIRETTRTVFAETLIYKGDLAEAYTYVTARKWSETTMERRLFLGATNPFKSHHLHTLPEADWVDSLNAFLNVSGTAAPILLSDAVGTLPYDRVTTAPLPQRTGPLVSIVMSSWQRAENVLQQAVKSVIAQTWASWELLVVDDASGPLFDDMYDRIMALDERIKVIRRRLNGGTYSARNTALSIACGDFIAFQDSDDWSHPQRLERQVQYLLDHPDVLACQTPCVRVDDDLSPVEPGFQPIRRNESSLVFRRQPTVRLLGFFDQARKGADSEYRLRLEHASGCQVPIVGPDPMALVRLTAGSLSRNELAAGFRSAGRFFYAEGFRHRHAAQHRASSWYRSHRTPPDHFVPASFRPKRVAGHAMVLDVALVADLRSRSDSAARVPEVARWLAGEGKRVGITQHFGLAHDEPPESSMDDAVASLIHDGIVEPATFGEEWHVGHVLVMDPTLLQFRPWGDARWTTGAVTVLHSPRDFDEPLFDRESCATTSDYLFGRQPRWFDSSQGLRNLHLNSPMLPTPETALQTYTPAELLDRLQGLTTLHLSEKNEPTNIVVNDSATSARLLGLIRYALDSVIVEVRRPYWQVSKLLLDNLIPFRRGGAPMPPTDDAILGLTSPQAQACIERLRVLTEAEQAELLWPGVTRIIPSDTNTLSVRD